MIDLKNLNDAEPYRRFEKYYTLALKKKQKNIEAIAISSINFDTNEINSRFVNLKYILNDKWVFFSNYESSKAQEFKSHQQISGLFFWHECNIQIRIKANVNKISKFDSDKHFKKRSSLKNALAISSQQSQVIDSYDSVVNNFNKVKDSSNLLDRPSYWGGYSFVPYYFEFWEGNSMRINKRELFQLNDKSWSKSILQP